MLAAAFLLTTASKNGFISLRDRLALFSPKSKQIDPGVASPRPKPDYWPKNYEASKKQVFKNQAVPLAIGESKIEYLPEADEFSGIVLGVSTREDYVQAKQNLENQLKAKDIKICDLFIYWTGDPEVMSKLEPQDRLTTGCF